MAWWVRREAPEGGSPARAARFAFAALVAAAVLLRVAKAHRTGVLYDEVVTWLDYAREPGAALTRYMIPNNHLLNSLAIHAAHGLFGGYEHFLRIPSLACGVLFVLSLAYAVARTISDAALRAAVFAAIAFHFLLFELSYLARGYALALGALGAALAWLVRVERAPAPRRALLLSAALLPLLNFVALGAMPTSLFALLALNAVLFARLGLREPGALGAAAGAAALAALATGVATFALYQAVLDPLLEFAARSGIGQTEAGVHLAKLFREGLFATGRSAAGLALARASAAFLLALAALGAAALCLGRAEVPARDEKTAVLLVAALALAATGVYGLLLGRPLGHTRNSAFLLLLLLLAAGAGLEAALARAGPRVRGALRAAALAALVGFGAWNLPSPRVVAIGSWAQHSLSGPLVRELRALDPERTWLVALAPELRSLLLPFRYYHQFGFRFRLVAPGELPDVVIRPDPELQPSGARITILR